MRGPAVSAANSRTPYEVSRMIDSPRKAAFDLLVAVREDDAYANLRWPKILEAYDLHGRDAAFATDLAYGTLRQQGTYDAIVDNISTRPLADIDPAIVDVLRLGCHQILSMRVPDHAAVDSSCELARAIGYEDAGRIGFINGVLRKVAAKDRETWLTDIASGEDDASVATATSHPEWIVSAIRESLSVGREVSPQELRRALEADNTPARPTLAVRSTASEPDKRAECLSPGRWSPLALSVDSGIPGDLPIVREGKAIVQDEGSQLVVQALLAVPVDPPESAWLDMCAGPGGKAALLADAAAAAGVQLQAVELHEHRAQLVRSLVGRVDVDVTVGDALSRPWGSRFFDRILLDAPCTGIGALRRRPEARWRRQAGDVRELTATQRGLLDTGLSSLRSGGVLGYVTCSPHVAETVDVVEEVLLHRDDTEIIDARPYFPGVEELGGGPHVQLWPHIHGTDAMHLTLLRRR